MASFDDALKPWSFDRGGPDSLLPTQREWTQTVLSTDPQQVLFVAFVHHNHTFLFDIDLRAKSLRTCLIVYFPTGAFLIQPFATTERGLRCGSPQATF